MDSQKTWAIPKTIKFISSSLFLFMIGWGLGTDTYFSLYIKSIIGNSRGVTLIWALLAMTKLIFSIPVGNINKTWETKDILLIGKIFYALCGFFFFLAGLESSVFFLLLAVIFNGIASSTTFTTYRNYYDKNANNENRSQIFWLYFSSINIAEIVGALISAAIVTYLELPFMYFFVIIFSLLALVQEQKIKTTLKKKWQQLKNRKKRKRKLTFEEQLNLPHDRIFEQEQFVPHFFRQCFSLAPRKKMFKMFKNYDKRIYTALGSITLTNLLNYIGFLFIPIISIENNLNLSQIAIIFAVMKLPYLVNIFIGNLGDKYSKKVLISFILISISGCYVLLGALNGFILTVILTFAISLGIALLNPISTALVGEYTQAQDKGQMAWVQEFASKLWEIVGSLGFGILTSFIGTQGGFICVGISIFILGIYLFTKKSLFRKKEKRKEKNLTLP